MDSKKFNHVETVAHLTEIGMIAPKYRVYDKLLAKAQEEDEKARIGAPEEELVNLALALKRAEEEVFYCGRVRWHGLYFAS